MSDISKLAREVLEKAVDKIEYKIAEDKDGRVWLLIDNSGHDIEIGDMETEDACCYDAYGKLFGFANAAPALARAVLEQQGEVERLNKRLRIMDAIKRTCSLQATCIAEQKLEIEAQQAEIERLREALEAVKPFYYVTGDDGIPKRYCWWCHVVADVSGEYTHAPDCLYQRALTSKQP